MRFTDNIIQMAEDIRISGIFADKRTLRRTLLQPEWWVRPFALGSSMQLGSGTLIIERKLTKFEPPADVRPPVELSSE